MASAAPLASLAIPLYRSQRFLDYIVGNIEAVGALPVEFLISDRHGLDDTLNRLQARFTGDSRFTFIKRNDGLNWVQHYNALLRAGRGRYFRWMPHDDTFPPGSLEALIAALEEQRRAVLAYSPTHAIDLEGRPLPRLHRERPHPQAAGDGWTLELCLDLVWKGYCDGAFKGVFRREPVIAAQHFIRPTRGLVAPERAWLFGLALLGSFELVPETLYVKRYYPGSTHSGWRMGALEIASLCRVMCGYAWRLIPGWRARLHALRRIPLLAWQRWRWLRRHR